MARKRNRVPEVLWRLFHHRARPLSHTILALIPPNCCCCNGQGCISCRRDKAISFLLRPSDPPGYRNLLNECFAVVSENAPPLQSFDPQNRCLQREIVKRSIAMIMHERSSSSNLICYRYDKDNCSSDVIDELTSSNWTLLLSRVGDALMIYLLKYTSLFLSMPQKKYHQITGYPISSLCFKSSRHMPDTKSRHPSMHKGSSMKWKRVGADTIPEKQIKTYSLDVECFSNSSKVVVKNQSDYVTREELPCEISERSSKQGIVSSQKRKRQYRWQRQRKRKQLVALKAQSLTPCGEKSCNSDTLSTGSQNLSYASDKNKTECFCCSAFRNVPGMNKNAEIDRKKLFYRLENSASMFPRKHILYTLKPNSSGASILFNNIFGTIGFDKGTETMPCFHNQNGGLVTPKCLYHLLTKLLKKLIRNTRNCLHLRLLEKHCPIKSSFHDSRGAAGIDFEGNDSEEKLPICEKFFRPGHAQNCEITSGVLANWVEPTDCPKKQVVSFIWAICRRIVPSPLLGEPSNWRILRKNLSKFIQLRKFEKFSLKECIHKLKISKFPLLSKLSRYVDNGCTANCITDTVRHAVFGCWVFWFFAHLVSPLLQTNFFVTGSEHGRQEVLYYRKPTWEKMIKEAECMKNKTYKLISYASTRKIMGKRPFGFSRGRLLPKKIGFRLVANLQAPSRLPVNVPPQSHFNREFQGGIFCNPVKYQIFKSVNRVLHDVHVVLSGLFSKSQERLGSSVFDYNDVYRKLVPFLFLMKNGSAKMPNVFIVVADVSKAYDSIQHDKLLNVMKEVILDHEYALEKFTQVICTKRSLMVHRHMKLVDEDTIPASIEKTSLIPTQSTGGVLVKKELDKKISKEKIDLLLKEHITHNIVQLNGNFYLQRVGIPQGSVLSSLLCSFYYEHMERNVVYPYLEKVNKVLSSECNTSSNSASEDSHTKEIIAGCPQHLLLRFIDDYLFISTSKMQASMFFTRLDRGIYDYNCSMNERKYGLNFNVDNEQPNISRRLYVGNDGVSFLCWSGLLVNCSTLEIQADYTRYLNAHLSSTLTISCRGKVGYQLKEKLSSYLLTKCHPIFYDSNINTPGVVRLNIYQAFLLCAMKFVCYISKLSVLPKFSPKFYFNAIIASLRYMSKVIKQKMHSFQTGNAFRPKYDVKNKDVVWLGLYAYNRVLKKKQSCHKELLRLFRYRLKAYGKVDNMSPELRYAVDDTHSSVFWKIKY